MTSGATFTPTATTFSHYKAGNLVDDGRLDHTYDAWQRMVKVTAKQDTDITIQTAAYDAQGRRIKKVVTNSGDLDGTWVYYYDGQQMIEAVDGSANLLVQTYHGTQYIDGVVAMKTDYGYMVVHQDANWNVVATTDLGGTVLERVFYSPYGEPTFNSETFFGDYDADHDVDATDDGNLGSGQTCWGTPSGACRVFDFNQDGTLNSSDETVMTALVALASTNHAHNNRTSSAIGMIFAHQGLILDPEISTYYNRMRTYNPVLQRFVQRDPLNLHPDAPSGYQDGMNLYTYERSNPIVSVDPDGKWVAPVVGGVVACVAALCGYKASGCVPGATSVVTYTLPCKCKGKKGKGKKNCIEIKDCISGWLSNYWELRSKDCWGCDCQGVVY